MLIVLWKDSKCLQIWVVTGLVAYPRWNQSLLIIGAKGRAQPGTLQDSITVVFNLWVATPLD